MAPSLWLLLAYAALFDVVAFGHMSWLLWRYVPLHAAIFEGMGTSVPPSTAIVFAASNWFVRLLPFFLLFVMVIAGALAVAVLLTLTSARSGWIVKGVAMILLVSGLAEAVVCAAIVHSVHAAYGQNLRAFDEYQQKQQPQPAQP